MDEKQLDFLSNASVPKEIRARIGEKWITAEEAENALEIEKKRLENDLQKTKWNTPLAAAAAGLLTLSATFIYDLVTAREETSNAITIEEIRNELQVALSESDTMNTITLEQVRNELEQSEARLKLELEVASSQSLAKLEAEAREREFQYEIVRAELEKSGKTNAERAEVLLFLARAGVFTALNADELALMAEEQKNNPEVTIIPELSSSSANGGAFSKRNIFRPEESSDVTYSFLEEPTVEMRRTVELATEEWAKHGNIGFRYVDDPAEAIIRIMPDQMRSSSYIGRTALRVGRDTPTMRLRNSHSNDEQRLTDFLHQFGHAIGMVHEHQSPNADIPWDEGRVTEYYRTAFGWDAVQTRHNILARSNVYPCMRDFDPQSIMMYSLPAELLSDEIGFERSSSLSEGDISCVREMYPITAE